MSTKRLDQLTFTRFAAVLVVLFFHGGGGIYLQAFDFFPFSEILISAAAGVTYLYALSGFVMSLAHYRPSEAFSFEEYWKARFTRLYPLYFVSFLLVCYYYADSVARIKLPKTLANVFAIQAWIPDYSQSFNFPSWSVTVEFFFYAVFPLFAFWAFRQSTKKIIGLSLILWAASQIIHNALWGAYYPTYYKFLIYFPLFHLSSFILGAAAGIWYLREGREQRINSRVNIALFAGGVTLTWLYVSINKYIAGIPHEDQLMTGLLAPFLTLTILTLALDTTRFSNFLKRPALVALGEISYAMYILHIPVKWLYERALENANRGIWFDYTYIPLIIALSFAAHFYFDQPIRVWLKNIMRRVSAPLFLIDFAILSASIYISFRFRFGAGREYASYSSMMLLMFWSAFILRTIFSTMFNALNPSILYGSAAQLIRAVLLSAAAGSAALATIVYIGYAAGIFYNFPRSVFVIDGLVVFSSSLLTRYLFRISGFYSSSASLRL